MDVYKFINSKDIREYLKKINYEFTPVEMAWLIWQCENMTLNEKHNAWNEIIETTPDMPIKNRTTDLPSLHQFLKNYMQLQRDIIDRFYNPDKKSVYRYSIYGTYNNSDEADKSENIYFDFQSCFESTLDALEELESPKISIEMRTENIKNRYNEAIEILFTAESNVIEDNKVISIINYGNLSDEEYDILFVFDNMWFAFPTPFKKGDIVIVPECRYECYNPYGCYSVDPFVLVETAYDKFKKDGKQLYDYTDMYAYGYFQKSKSLIYDKSVSVYMNMKHYTGELKDDKRLLKGVSELLKEEIDLKQFTYLCQQVLVEEYVDNHKKAFWFIDNVLTDKGKPNDENE